MEDVTDKIKAIVTPNDDRSWQQKLSESTGQWAFVLTLSRRMIFALGLVRDGTWRGAERPNPGSILGRHGGGFVAAVHPLISRGLVWHKWPEPKGNYYGLTPAGEAVCRLLEYAGLLAPAEEKPKRKRA
jgi:hypothetical protein